MKQMFMLIFTLVATLALATQKSSEITSSTDAAYENAKNASQSLGCHPGLEPGTKALGPCWIPGQARNDGTEWFQPLIGIKIDAATLFTAPFPIGVSMGAIATEIVLGDNELLRCLAPALFVNSFISLAVATYLGGAMGVFANVRGFLLVQTSFGVLIATNDLANRRKHLFFHSPLSDFTQNPIAVAVGSFIASATASGMGASPLAVAAVAIAVPIRKYYMHMYHGYRIPFVATTLTVLEYFWGLLLR